MLDAARFRQRELLGSGGFADVYRPLASAASWHGVIGSILARYEKLDSEGHATESFAVKEVDLQILRWP